MSLPGSFAGVSARRVVGFACFLGYLYSQFYMGLNRAYRVGAVGIERIELLGVLLVMLAALGAMNVLAKRAPNVREIMLERHSVAVYAAMMVAGGLMPAFIGSLQTDELVFESIMVGLPSALTLLAWARCLAEGRTGRSTAEVVSAGGIGAAACLAAYAVPFADALWAMKFLPIVSAVLLLAEMRAQAQDDQTALNAGAPTVSASTAVALSVKVQLGAGCFGVAAGFMETYNSNPGAAAMATFPASLLLLVLFCVGALQLLYARDPALRSGLDGAYRLSLLVMMAGFLFAPVLEGTGVPGESIVLAGYLGLTCVLISLFLVFAKIAGEDAARSMARGFAGLYLGEVAGIALANVSNGFTASETTPYAIVCAAGLLTLFAYLFLFTERDFRALSEIARSVDFFAATCAAIAEEAGLSKREAEILPMALRGRTSERIAGELFISKSTVDTHLRRIYGKTGVHGRQELIDLGERTTERLAAEARR